MAQLRLLEQAAEGDEPRAFRGVAAKLYPGLFVAVAELREGDLKTDLDTAAFLYAEVGRAWAGAGEAAADCGRERPDIYRPLCLGLRGGTRRQLLAAKARLHTRWAAAVVNQYRGSGGDETALGLAAVRAAREHDSNIAAQAVETLKPLEELVNTFPTYADYLERRDATRVGFDQLEARFAAALGSAGALIASLPRGPAYYRLRNAYQSYRDGLYWYGEVYRSRKLVVSAGSFERDLLEELGLDADQLGYAVVVCWKKAARYTRLAERTLPAARR